MREGASLRDDVVEWDVENWSRALDFWERHACLGPGSKCLELGARRGGLSLWLALAGHSVICSDLEENSAAAGPLHEAYGVREHVVYESIDATAIPYENRFDAVAFKSLLGGVAWNGDAGRQAAAVRAMHRALKPGGVLLFAENLRGSALHQAARRRFVRWNGVWRYVTIGEMLAYLEPFSSVEYGTTGFSALFGRSPRLSSLLGKIDGAILNRVTPPQWHYVIYGVARK